MTANSQSEPEIPWFKSSAFKVTVVGAILAAVLGVLATQLTKPHPPPGPNSNNASFVIDDHPLPAPFAHANYQFSGSGWNGDTAVTITFP